MAEENNSSKEKLKEDLKKIIEDIEELNKDLGETGEDIEETGRDVEDIKEDIEEIKEDIGMLSKAMFKGKQIVSKVAISVLPGKFAFKDVAQQIIGATILSAPFSVTEEVWNLANNLQQVNVILIVLLTILFDVLLFYYAKYQAAEGRKLFDFVKRIASLIIVTYVTSAVVLTVFGVIGGKIQDPFWAMRLVVMVGLFANIGASTADLIK